MRKAIIFGVTGQDGSYLAELLLRKDYKVFGVARRSSNGNLSRLYNVINDPNFELLTADVTDPYSTDRVLYITKDVAWESTLEVYNLAAQSNVYESFLEPLYTTEVIYQGTMNVLHAIRNNFSPNNVKYYQASSSEMFGSSRGNRLMTIPDTAGVPTFKYKQDENTPFVPNSPYGIAKLAGYHLTTMYRKAYNIFACNGILFNHESERRSPMFVSRKITQHVAKLFVLAHKDEQLPPHNIWTSDMYKSKFDENTSIPVLKLGNLSAYRDWGYAPDYVEAMWLMLQQDKPDNYVIATGEAYTVKDFLTKAFEIGLGYYSDRFVEIDSHLYRALEVDYLCGDTSKAEKLLGWQPKVTFNQLVRKMVVADVIEECRKAGLTEEHYATLIGDK